MNRDIRAQVQFAEPSDASFAQQLELSEGTPGLSPMALQSNTPYSYEALGLLVMGLGLLGLALIITVARSIKSK
ncbi:MAG: hypothetical protein ACKKL4_02410 [Patescibacteria group bacterium]